MAVGLVNYLQVFITDAGFIITTYSTHYPLSITYFPLANNHLLLGNSC